MTIICNKGCCLLNTTEYNSLGEKTNSVHRNKKSGILLYDKKTNSILIVQSRGNLWGIPKGTVENGESYIDCAFREVLEETGLNLLTHKLESSVTIGNSIYYLVYHEKCDVDVQKNNENNDVNSIGWIKLDCLKELINQNILTLTKHSIDILKMFLEFEL